MKPPFRADQVGSLLRPKELAEARTNFKQGRLDRTLKEVEDRCIREAIARQEADRPAVDHRRRDSAATGGTWTSWRSWTASPPSPIPGPKFGGTEEQPPIPSVTGKVGCSKPIMVERFRVPEGRTPKQTAKFTMPSPAMLHLRGGRSSISKEIYPDLARILGRHRRRLPQGDPAARRRRLQLPAAGRRELLLPLRPEDPGNGAQERRRSGEAAAHLRRRGERGAQGPARRHDGDHAHLPRQLQEQLGGLGRLRDRWPRRCSPRRWTRSSWSSTTSAPAASSRCATCRRARKSCWDW